jgi:hypothetical protein
MAGNSRSGRPKKPGKVYEFNFYYRWIPGEDPPELKAVLEELLAATGRKRRDILRAALLGGAGDAQDEATKVEDSEDSTLIDDMFAGF